MRRFVILLALLFALFAFINALGASTHEGGDAPAGKVLLEKIGDLFSWKPQLKGK